MVASNTYGRQVVLPLANKSGGGVIAGDVVVIDTGNNDAFTTTTSAAVTNVVGIAQETIANNATGRVLLSGYAALVLVNASVTRGNYGATHTVAKQAADAGASRTAGTFCKFLTGGTTPDAVVFGSDLGGGGSGSITASGYTQDTARLLGRTTASSGAIEEITVGSGLSLAAGSLTATGGGATWTSWTPTVTQSGSVSVTVTQASYADLGDATLFRCSLEMTAAGTGNNPIVIAGQPAALQDSEASTGATTIIGSGILRDEGTAYYMVNIVAYAATAWRLITYNSTGYAGTDPNFALASGDKITLVGTVRTA
jgi:uncharacterized Zn-binding protein involved in type VI secretion